MTLKGKFTILSAVLVIVVTLAAVQNHFILQALIADVTAGDRAAEMLRRHMHADMMHDALRAEVMRSLLAVPAAELEWRPGLLRGLIRLPLRLRA